MTDSFYCCSRCGKKLIQRKKNGIWVFLFGKSECGTPVHMEIYGHVKMRCMRRSCRRDNPDHWNVFNFLPDPIEVVEEF